MPEPAQSPAIPLWYQAAQVTRVIIGLAAFAYFFYRHILQLNPALRFGLILLIAPLCFDAITTTVEDSKPKAYHGESLAKYSIKWLHTIVMVASLLGLMSTALLLLTKDHYYSMTVVIGYLIGCSLIQIPYWVYRILSRYQTRHRAAKPTG